LEKLIDEKKIELPLSLEDPDDGDTLLSTQPGGRRRKLVRLKQFFPADDGERPYLPPRPLMQAVVDADGNVVAPVDPADEAVLPHRLPAAAAVPGGGGGLTEAQLRTAAVWARRKREHGYDSGEQDQFAQARTLALSHHVRLYQCMCVCACGCVLQAWAKAAGSDGDEAMGLGLLDATGSAAGGVRRPDDYPEGTDPLLDGEYAQPAACERGGLLLYCFCRSAPALPSVSPAMEDAPHLGHGSQRPRGRVGQPRPRHSAGACCCWRHSLAALN
jgi:hypothetical protein